MLSLLKLEDQFEDKRGKMFFFSSDNKRIALVETKKGFARGGHYHLYEQDYVIISGKFEHREKDVVTSIEQTEIVEAPKTIHMQKNKAQLFIALEDSMLVYVYNNEHKSVNYPEYRKIIEEKMK